MGDSDLLQRARTDADAFHLFYRRHCVEVDRWLRRETGDLDVAAELTAEAFAQAWLGLKRYKGEREGDGAAWLFGIARNLARQYFRTSRVERSARKKLKVEMSVRQSEDARVDLAAGPLAPELLEAIEQLPQAERDALLLRVVSQHSYSEVAGRLECSENAARLRVSRALRSLRTTLPDPSAHEDVALLDGGARDE
jgi:RNA polymerase sigma-70 factor (ECF subfamily)